MIHVVAMLTASPGQRGFVLAAFNKMRPLVLEEEGCIEYQPLVDADGGDRIGADSFMVVEKWTSSEALDAHNKGANLGLFLQTVKPHLAHLTVHILKAAP